MPTKPERPEKNPPVRNANGTNGVKNPAAAKITSTINITAKNMPTVLYCLLRYAIAPFLILELMFAMVSVPSGLLLTEKNFDAANTSAITAHINTAIGAMFSIKYHSLSCNYILVYPFKA